MENTDRKKLELALTLIQEVINGTSETPIRTVVNKDGSTTYFNQDGKPIAETYPNGKNKSFASEIKRKVEEK